LVVQKFTRALTREVEIDGERVAITLSAEGVSIRPVGSRKPPRTLTWKQVVDASAGHPPESHQPAEHAPAHHAPIQQGDTPAVHSSAGHPPESHKPAQHPPAQHPPIQQSHAPAQHPPVQPLSGGHVPQLETALARIEKWFHEYRPEFLKGLRPGISPAELKTVAGELPVVPPELTLWLGWHNGQSEDALGAIQESWQLLSAAEVVSTYQECLKEPGWRKGWIPFLADDQGDYVLLDTETVGHPVREVWRGKPGASIVANSLGAWATTFADDVTAGKYTEDSERGEFIRATDR
jgi:cell wall assembly regulator SMI1